MAKPGRFKIASDEALLDFIAVFTDSRGYPPSYREIADGLGFATCSAIGYRLRRLERKGLLVRVPGYPRTLRVVGTE
jgi:repressor LexA